MDTIQDNNYQFGEKLTDEDLLEFYYDNLEVIDRNIGIYKVEANKIITDIKNYIRFGQITLDDRTFVFKPHQQADFEDFILSVKYACTSEPECRYVKTGVSNWLHIYTSRLMRLKSLRKVLRAWKSGNESEVHPEDTASFRAIRVAQVLSRYGVEVSAGMCKCPIHNEKTPSFRVYEGTNSWYCFGCGKGGNSIDLVCELEKKPFREVINILKTMV